MNEFDPFDLDRLRLSPEAAAELARAKAERDAGKRKGSAPGWVADKIAATSTGAGKTKLARSQKRFTKIPGTWEETLAKARVSGATYAVAIVLLHEAWKLASNGYRPDVKVTNVMLKRVHVTRKGKRAALLKLSGLGLVGVQWRGQRSPIVMVHFFD
jgi:hypothetical protein